MPQKVSGHKKTSSASPKASASAAKGAKGSKLATLKSAIFGAAKKKMAAVAPAGKAAKAKPAKAETKAAAPAPVAPAGKKAKATPAAPVSAKKGAAAKNSVSSATAAATAAMARIKPGSVPEATPTAKLAKGAKGKKGAAAGAPRLNLGSGRVTYDSNGDAVCREVACEGLATSAGYCRMHYIKNWKKIKRKEVILKEGKLNQYIEELVAKYPEKYIEAIRQDLAADKEFAKVIYDLDLDESVDDFAEGEGESIDSVIGDIKRDFDEDSDF